jgi:tetratricopeptide (TPR) repeat protein
MPQARADADPTFARANADYASGKFKNAIDGYESLVKAGQWNPSLFYNLGNAYFRTEDFGRAILNYERALALDPVQPEAKANLQLVRDRARALELNRNWADEHLDFLTRDQFTWLAAGGFLGRGGNCRRALFFEAPAGGLDFCPAVVKRSRPWLRWGRLCTGEWQRGPRPGDRDGQERSSPTGDGESAGTVLALPPGSEIKILSTRGNWDYAALPNDLQGWIPVAERGSASACRRSLREARGIGAARYKRAPPSG